MNVVTFLRIAIGIAAVMVFILLYLNAKQWSVTQIYQ